MRAPETEVPESRSPEVGKTDRGELYWRFLGTSVLEYTNRYFGGPPPECCKRNGENCGLVKQILQRIASGGSQSLVAPSTDSYCPSDLKGKQCPLFKSVLVPINLPHLFRRFPSISCIHVAPLKMSYFNVTLPSPATDSSIRLYRSRWPNSAGQLCSGYVARKTQA